MTLTRDPVVDELLPLRVPLSSHHHQALDCLPDNVEVFPNRISGDEHAARAVNFFEQLAQGMHQNGWR
jgi:hypothetical protein